MLQCLVPFLLLALNFALVWPALFPGLADIESWDESLYILNGAELAHGMLPCLVNKPLSAILYAGIYQFVGQSPTWFVQSCAIGRVVLFILLWLSSFKLAHSMKRYFNPLIMPLLLLSTNWPAVSIRWAGDSLFSTCACLSLAYAIAFQEEKKVKDIMLAGLFVGLASLARREGLLLIVPLVISVLLDARPVSRSRKVVFSLLPLIVVLGLFTGWHLLRQHDSGWEVPKEQLYDIFAQGQVSLLEHPVTGYSGVGNKWREGQRLTEQIYGDRQANDNSMLKAIVRNPIMFFISILHRLAMIPHHFFMFTAAVGAAHIFLSVRGIIGLCENREFKTLFLMLAWLLPFVAQVALCFAERMVLLDYFVVMALACLGVRLLLDQRGVRNEFIGWGFLLSIVLLCQRLLDKLATGTLLFVSAVGCVVMFKTKLSQYLKNADGLLILVCVLMYVHLSYLPPVYKWPHADEIEQANLFLQKRWAPNTRLIAWAPRDIVAAKLEFVDPWPLLNSKRGADETIDYLRSNNIQAIYIDDEFRRDEPKFCKLIDSLSGHGLTSIYRSHSGVIEIFSTD